MEISVIDIEGREKIIAYVVLHHGVYYIYSLYGIDEDDLRRFLIENDLDIQYEIVDSLFILNRVHDVIVGWNLQFDLRMLVKEYAMLLSTYEFKIIDMYREIIKIENMPYSLARYVYENYGANIRRYSQKYTPEKMYRYMKCIMDVYYTNLIYQRYKNFVEIKTVFFSPYSRL